MRPVHVVATAMGGPWSLFMGRRQSADGLPISRRYLNAQSPLHYPAARRVLGGIRMRLEWISTGTRAANQKQLKAAVACADVVSLHVAVRKQNIFAILLRIDL